MTTLRIIVSFLAVVATLLQGLLNYKFQDKRTNVFKRLRTINFAVLTVVAVGTVVLTTFDSNEIADLRAEIARLAPRGLSEERFAVLVRELKDLAPHEISIITPPGSDESLHFAGEILRAFAAAGWKASGPGQKAYGGLANGLVLFASREVSDELVRPLVTAFAEAGVDISVMPPRGAAIAIDAPVSQLELFIGVK